MSSYRILFVTCCLLACADDGLAQTQIELTTATGTKVGRPVAHNSECCWLAEPTGRFSFVSYRDVTSFKKRSQPFQPASAVALRESLKQELGRTFDVQTRGPFVVAAPVGQTDAYARLLDQLARSFSRYTSVRRLPVQAAEFPMIVVIYAHQQQFAKVARQDGITVNDSLRGYYHPLTNRVALYESSFAVGTVSRRGFSVRHRQADLPADTVSTLIHEGIHQLAFNHGLHSRIGENPRWIVEGLATVLEVNAQRDDSNSLDTASINPQRYQRFQKFRKQRRHHQLADFLVEDESMFRQSPLDAYSEAWALTYFLVQDYPSEYAAFLRLVAQRDPLQGRYSPEKRLADFTSAFGQDLAWMEVRFNRFFDTLATTELAFEN